MPLQPSERALELAGQVLAKIAAYDPRFPRPNEAMLRAWGEHITMRNPEPEDMLDAVTKWYAEPHDRIPMPFDISNIAREMRRDRMARGKPPTPPNRSNEELPPELPGAQPITMAEWERRHGQKFPRLAVGRSIPGEDGPNPLRVKCRFCHATPGFPCTTYDGRPLTKHRAHPSRIEDAEKLYG